MEEKVRIRVAVKAEEKAELVEKAKEAGMSMSAYMRKQIQDSEVIIRQLQLTDLSEFAKAVREANAEIDSYMGIIKVCGRVYPQQLEKIMEILKELKDKTPDITDEPLDKLARKELRELRKLRKK